MSLIKDKDYKLSAVSNTIRQNYYLSAYYSIIKTPVFIQFKNPILFNNNPNFRLLFYEVDFGDSTGLFRVNPEYPLYHEYNFAGTYFVSYSAIYADIEESTIVYPYVTDVPFRIKESWQEYNPNNIRLNDEILLTLPYTLEQIEIQPNEWGVEDIFNTSIFRLQECLDYLTAKTQTINTYSPTLFFGWLGNNTGTLASNIKWFTYTYNFSFLDKPELAQSKGNTFFTNIQDSIERNDYLYVIDNGKIRLFLNLGEPIEYIINQFERGPNLLDSYEILKTNSTVPPIIENEDISAYLYDPVSIAVHENENTIYVLDRTYNTLFKLNAVFDNENITVTNNQIKLKATVNLQLTVGGFGGLIDNNNFNTPTQVIFNNNNVYVLDYNNFCVKRYNQDLNWVYTYFSDDFNLENRPISIAALKNGLLYVLTQNNRMYIFDDRNNTVFATFDLPQIDTDLKTVKICFDENENFLYVLLEKEVYKYTISGDFVSILILPNDAELLTYNNIQKGKNQTFLISTKNCILKFHDLLETFKIGDGAEVKYWDKNQLKVYKNEFATDLNYNRSLIRIAQNIKTFRDTLDSKFVILSENLKNKIITYFSFFPIDAESESPILHIDVENEILGVGVNELHIPSTINSEIKKLYQSLEILSDFLSVKNFNVDSADCLEYFCWSWNATSCFQLELPSIKTCNINPISFKEIKVDKLSEGRMRYVPKNAYTYDLAFSKCCKK
jgi:hypothetical protein